jgi:hypothetical protein
MSDFLIPFDTEECIVDKVMVSYRSIGLVVLTSFCVRSEGADMNEHRFSKDSSVRWLREHGRWIVLAVILAVAALGIHASEASAIVGCNPGEWQDPVTHVCKPAPPGHYANGLHKYPCAAGTYQPLAGQAACWPADIGYFVQNPGSTVQHECTAGSYQPYPRKSFCYAALAGRYVPGSAAYEQLDCPVGTYQDLEGQSFCKPAPVGHYVDKIKAHAPTPCAPGSYQDEEEQESCKLAPIDTYVDTHGATAPTDCPPGTSNPTEGAKSESACQAPATEKPESTADPNKDSGAESTEDVGEKSSETPTPKPQGDQSTTDDLEKLDEAIEKALAYVIGIMISLGLGGVIWFIIKRLI